MRGWLSSQSVRDYETSRIGLDEFCRRLAAEFELDGFTAEQLAKWRLPMPPRVERVLRRLAETHSLALLSNTNAVHWNSVNRQSDVFDGFSQVFLSYEIGLHKPELEIFEHVLGALGVAAEQVVFFDDSEPNVLAARTLGIDAHHVDGFADVERIASDRWGVTPDS